MANALFKAFVTKHGMFNTVCMVRVLTQDEKKIKELVSNFLA